MQQPHAAATATRRGSGARPSRPSRRAGRAARRARRARGSRRPGRPRSRRLHVDAEADRDPLPLQQVAPAPAARRADRDAPPRRKNSARRKRPARSGSSAPMRCLVEPFVVRSVRSAKRGEFGRVARQRHDQAAVARRAGKRRAHQSIVGAPERRPPPRRSPRARTRAPACRRPSTSRRRRPASGRARSPRRRSRARLSSSAVARPATPAPTTVTFDGLNALLPFLRRHDPDQVQRVQPHRLSQTGSCGNRTPLGRRQNKLPTAPAVKRPGPPGDDTFRPGPHLRRGQAGGDGFVA